MDEFYTIPEHPEYSEEIRKLQDTDPASASETFNPLVQRLIENIAAIKRTRQTAGAYSAGLGIQIRDNEIGVAWLNEVQYVALPAHQLVNGIYFVSNGIPIEDDAEEEEEETGWEETEELEGFDAEEEEASGGVNEEEAEEGTFEDDYFEVAVSLFGYRINLANHKYVDDGAGNVYSDKREAVVGRWVDGKPIYRRVLKAKTGTMQGSSAEVDAYQEFCGDIDQIVSVNGIAFPYSSTSQDNGKSVPLPYLDISAAGTVNICVWISTTLSSMQIKQSGSGDGLLFTKFAAVPVTVMIEYTKKK